MASAGSDAGRPPRVERRAACGVASPQTTVRNGGRALMERAASTRPAVGGVTAGQWVPRAPRCNVAGMRGRRHAELARRGRSGGGAACHPLPGAQLARAQATAGQKGVGRGGLCAGSATNSRADGAGDRAGPWRGNADAPPSQGRPHDRKERRAGADVSRGWSGSTERRRGSRDCYRGSPQCAIVLRIAS